MRFYSKNLMAFVLAVVSSACSLSPSPSSNLSPETKEQIASQARKKAIAIKEKIESESRFLCEFALKNKEGSNQYNRCYENALKLKVAEEKSKMEKETAEIAENAINRLKEKYSSEKTIRCINSFNATECNY